MILKEILTQYKNYVYIEDENLYSQLTISNNGLVYHRDIKKGVEIGRKRQFVIDLATNPHTLIFTRQGIVEGSIGIVPKEMDGYIVTENMPMFSINTDIVNPQYLIMFLKSKEYKEQIRKIIPSGTAQKALHEDKWTLIEISLPPLKEQNQIVAKYINCLPDLEKVLLKTSKQEKYVPSLRQAILQQAVEGKLCKQDPSDEPANVLLEKIKAEKEKLIAEKKIKKQKELPPITDEEKPFDLPHGWEWCRLGDICDITDGTHQTPRYTETGMPFLSAQNVKPFRFMPEIFRTVSKDDYDMYVKSTKAEKGDILMARVGAGIGEAAIVDKHIDFAIYVSLCLIKAYFMELNMQYLLNWINGVYGKEASLKNTLGKGTSQGNLNLNLIRTFIIPLPPLAEQQRIVEKVDRLMALCDELEHEVTSAKKYASQLMEAVLQEAFSNNKEKTTDNVIVFTPTQKPASESLLAAARGNMREETWENLRARALELASEGS